MNSEQIAADLNLSRGTIIHHINKLVESGLVLHRGNDYLLRVDNLSELIDELEKDVHRTLTDLREVASDIDKRLKR